MSSKKTSAHAKKYPKLYQCHTVGQLIAELKRRLS